MNAQIGSLLHLGFGLVLLWILVYVGWRPYRIDRVRNELFTLRNELFMFAARGGIAFDDAAYTLLTSRINAVIRFAHTITFTQLILYSVQERFTPTPGLAEQQKRMSEAIDRLPQKSKDVFVGIYQRAGQTIAWHMLVGSPLLLIVGALSLPLLIIKSWLRQQKESPATVVSKELRVTLIEEQAVMAQQRESDDDDLFELMQHA